MRPYSSLAAAFAAALSSGCLAEPQSAPVQNGVQAARSDPRAVVPDRTQTEAGDARFIIDRGDRKLRVYRGDELIREEPVAVGRSRYPTPLGQWRFTRVDINPEWIPPHSDWTRGRHREPPGSPANPMGRARLLFDPPYSIHGTDDLASLGSAASHGSIRVSNEAVVALAELLLKAGGSWEGPDWFRQKLNDHNRMYQIALRDPVVIEVVA